MNSTHSFCLVLAMAVCGLPGEAATHNAATDPPALVKHPVEETDITTITLAPEAEERLAIATASIERKSLPRARYLGGSVVLPLAGETTEERQSLRPVYMPQPPASPAEVLQLAELQTVADGEVRKARVELQAAEIRAERMQQLVRSETGSQRDLDDAMAALELARTSGEVARSRRELLGAPVEAMKDLDHVWVRVPVYVGDLPSLDPALEAQVGGLGDRPGSVTRAARRVAGPPSSDPAAATIDWFYRVANEDGLLRLGQRVGVTVPLRGSEPGLVVPWAAVLHDMHGGQWVYERVSPRTYARRRVEVARVVNREAVLTSGPPPGTEVVTDGAAELFGTEFGAGH